jgi:DNA-directed RNA polymerase subunit RPC12/RpoP
MSKLINPASGAPPTQLEQQAQAREMARLLKAASTIACENCGNKNFLLVYRIKKISGLMTGQGKDIIVPIATYACSDCGHLNKEMLTHLGEDEEEETPLTDTKSEQ